MYYDLRNVWFEGFLDFIFNRPVVPQFCEANWGRDTSPEDCWYDSIDLDIDFDPARNCEYLALLFSDPLVVRDRYSLSQLEQGFQWMQTSFNDGSAGDILWTGSLPLGRRVALIHSMYYLFTDLFAFEPLDRAPRVWWESMARRIPGCASGATWWADRQIVEGALFQTMASLLELDSEKCRIDALRGLAHLAHPGKQGLILDYLDRHPGLDENHRRHAEGAIAGALSE
jgi:hypothetical protein